VIRTLLIAIITSILFIGLLETIPLIKSQNAYAIIHGSCQNMPFLWGHTYGASPNHQSPKQTHSRLKELQPECVVFDGHVRDTPTGTEHDGDVSFNVDPDTKDDKDLLNSNNTKGLHVEVICAEKPDYNTYSNFQGHYCDGAYPSHIDTSKIQPKTHVRITGKWVKDVGYPHPDHAEWNEIHPVESIQILP
jgi:hypothetical protein